MADSGGGPLWGKKCKCVASAVWRPRKNSATTPPPLGKSWICDCYVIQGDLDVEQKTVLANGAQAMTGIMDMDDHFINNLPNLGKRTGCGYEELRGYTESAKTNNQYMLKKQVL